MAEAAATPATVTISGILSIVTDKAVVIANSPYHLNGVQVDQKNIGKTVSAQVCGNNLVSVSYPDPELSKGHGTIKILDIEKQVLEYEFTWKDKQTGEVKTGTKLFDRFTDAVKPIVSGFKIGDKVAVRFLGKTLHTIEVDTPKPFGWSSKKPYDPEAEKRRQKYIARESVLDKAVNLWIATLPKDTYVTDDGLLNAIPGILKVAEKFEEWVMRE